MPDLRLALAAALALLAATPAVAGAAPRAETGLAAYYRDDLRGSRTASGQPYDPTRLTCAHRSHPFGAWLEVVNLENGRKVRVMVNDRGPWTRGRVVDLSREAARQLGMLKRGTARVRVVRVT
ncbi:MAG TPA: septal ring lytic transglycosylase RlpA family protein [Anaeromyxobacteraceae bacterium]|nr:septal ring lytic transglycosylase RlpA family protein [Anaeromyxobacteraceae bacterium]